MDAAVSRDRSKGRGLGVTRGSAERARMEAAVSCDRRNATAGQRGQASVEVVAVLPFVLLAGIVAWQLALAGHAAWLAGNAARVATRADAVGRDAGKAARSALPDAYERDLGVERLRGGGVRVSVRVPLLMPGWRGPVVVRAVSSLGRSR